MSLLIEEGIGKKESKREGGKRLLTKGVWNSLLHFEKGGIGTKPEMYCISRSFQLCLSVVPINRIIFLIMLASNILSEGKYFLKYAPNIGKYF